MPVIVTKLEFFRIAREPGPRYSVTLDKSILGEAPEAFDAVDADVAACVDPVAAIHLKTPVATKHREIIDPALVLHAYRCSGP